MNRRFRLIIFLLVLLIAASGVSYASADGTSAYIFSSDGKSTNLSSEPSDSPEYVVGSLPHGTSVVLTWISDDAAWGYITLNDYYYGGYVPISELSASNTDFVSVLNDFSGTYIMYVCTVEGDSLNVRSGPSLSEDIIGSLGNTSPVHVVDLYYTSDWASIKYDQGGNRIVLAYVANRYLSEYSDGIYRGEIFDDMLIDSETPEPESTPEPTPAPKGEPEELSPTELIAELRTAKTVAEPFTVSVHPSHPTGRVNLRWAPFKRAKALTSYTSGKELTVIGETQNWYQVNDPAQKYSGFIAKHQVTASDFGTAD